MSQTLFENVVVGATVWLVILTVNIATAIVMIHGLRSRLDILENEIAELDADYDGLSRDFGHMQDTMIRELGDKSKPQSEVVEYTTSDGQTRIFPIA